MSAAFTPEQEDAIRAKNRFIIVSAAAGSGKTTVLIEKLIRMLSDPEDRVRADTLAAVTFTRDAAEQIKRRLAKALKVAVAECCKEKSAENEEKKRWLMKQQTYLAAAKISTINSFCLQLIRSYADILGISPDFRIIDEREGNILLVKAIENTADRWFADSERTAAADSLFRFFGFYTNNISDKVSKYGELMSFRSFLLSIPFYKKRFTERFLAEYQKGFDDSFDPFKSFYGGYYAGKCLSVLDDEKVSKAAKTVYGGWKNVIGNGAFEERLKEKKQAYGQYMKTFEGVLNLGEFFEDKPNIDKLPPKEKWDKYISAMNVGGGLFRIDLSSRTKTSTVKAVGDIAVDEGLISDTDYDAEEIIESFDIIGKAFAALPNIAPCTAEQLKNDHCSQYEKLKLVTDFIEEVNENYDSLKSEKNGLVFADGEQLALKLLGTLDDKGNVIKTDVANNLSKDLSLIMIDEFQDSNELQDTIFRLIAAEGDSLHAGKNMFVVGDVKQSIYNFRLADPTVFSGYLKSSAHYDREKPDTVPAHVLLNKNFRSSTRVITFVNYIFGRIMREPSGGVDYDDTHKLIYSGEVWEGSSENSAKAAAIGDMDTEILLIDKKNTSFRQEAEGKETVPQETTDTDDEIAAARLEAEAVALKIYKLLHSHKGISARDICILCIANADLPIFAEALRRLGIKSALENKSEYIASREISIVLNILKILDDPYNNIAMTGALMSPVYMFTAEDAAELSLIRGNSSYYRTLHMAAEDRYPEGCPLDGEQKRRLGEKCRRFLESYERMKKKAAVTGLEELVRSIYRETDIVELMSLYPDGKVRRDNLELLPSYVRAYEKSAVCGTGGIYGFIRYVAEASAADKTDFQSAGGASEADDAVAVKTMHRSKGLEYPIVFLCRTSKDMPAINGRMLSNNTAGAAFLETEDISGLSYEPMSMQTVKAVKLNEQLSEKVRLLYVGATRAKHKLYISGIVNFTAYKAKFNSFEDADADFGKDKIYSNFECDVTKCPPDGAVMKLYNDAMANGVFKDDGSIDGERMLDLSSKMLYWVLQALMNSGNIPYLETKTAADRKGKKKTAEDKSAAAAEVSEENASAVNTDNRLPVKIKLIRADHELTKKLTADRSSDGLISAAEEFARADEAFAAELERFKAYDTAEEFARQRLYEKIPAKLTVTEISHRTAEEEYVPHFDTLPRKYTVNVNEGLTAKLTASRKGTAVHAFMQYADLKALARSVAAGESDPVGEEAARLYLEGLLEESAAYYIEGDSRIKNRIKSFFGSALWKDTIFPADENSVLHEVPFMAKFSDIFDENSLHPLDIKLKTYYNNYDDTFIQGIADLIIRDKDSFTLVDFKTNAGRTPDELREMYSTQLALYTRVFEKIWQLPDGAGKALIYSFGIDSECTVDIGL